eukprot:GDKJ01019489.1.p2 GENE.GDKJ01019489.1~~GDKJ01019489.1.p2  ORF type:complete len:150 (+),score=10.16 GDKJ01019489.1:802-1251(+)
MIMATLFVTKSRSYDETIDNLDEIPKVDDPEIGGKTYSGEDLAVMISDLSNEIIAKAFRYPAYLFDKDSIKRLTEQPGYEGLAIYFVKYLGRISVALFAIDKDLNPVKTKVQKIVAGKIIIEEGIFGEEDGTGHPPSKVYELLKTLRPD